MTEKLGYFSLVLHSHLPWVLNHGIWPHGTSWLNEAAAESYIPILDEINNVISEGYSPKLTIGLTPVLCESLSHPSFINDFVGYLDQKINAALQDQHDFKQNNYHIEHIKLAERWEKFYSKIKDNFISVYNRNIIGAFKELQDKDYLDIITCAATHGYSALLSRESSIQAQYKIAVDNYKKHFGIPPTGAWIPECAYRPGYKWKNPITGEEYDRPGVEYFLAKNGIKYFFVDTVLLLGGKSMGVYAARFPLLQQLWKQFASQYNEKPLDFEKSQYETYLVSSSSPQPPVGFFTRDEKTGIVVWSGEHGYPGCAEYLDFHKKHFPGGHRYWKVTHAKIDLADKMLYWPDDIPRKLDENAGHFVNLVKDVLREYKDNKGKPGIISAMYDTELYGHWWFEGPWWINRILRWLEDDPEVELIHSRGYLEKYPPNKTVQLLEGSWGQGSSHWVWINEWSTWVWAHIYDCEKRCEEIMTNHANTSDMNLVKILKQLARENLLLQSSDWPFLITTWSARDYAENRVALHFENFNRLYTMASRYANGEYIDEGEWHFLGKLEFEDGIFQDIDIKAFMKE